MTAVETPVPIATAVACEGCPQSPRQKLHHSGGRRCATWLSVVILI
jgi:hypothetical protein